MPSKIDLTGQRFGRLTVLQEVPKNRPGAFWLCLCECKAEIVVRSGNLRQGATRSCGCLQVDVQRERRTTHGKSGSSEYKCWENMTQRCINPSNRMWLRYGGRGIECRFESFEGFLAEAGHKPSSRHTIDRIDNNGHYEPGNIRWALRKPQQRNLSSNRLITWQGRTQCLAAWAEELGLPFHVLQSRLSKYGWSVERAFTTPKAARKPRQQSPAPVRMTNNGGSEG